MAENSPASVEVLADIKRTLARRGQADIARDNFTLLISQLVGNPSFAQEVQKHADAKNYDGLLDLFAAHQIEVSAEALATFLATQDTWGKLRQLAKAFGHDNLGTFN